MLREARALDRVFQEGRFSLKGDLALHFISNGLAGNRFAFVISGKVGKAHERNAIRRRMREIVSEILPLIASGNDIAFVARKGIEGSYARLRSDMRWLLANRGLLSDEGA
jgi:ribonuclease P protein component